MAARSSRAGPKRGKPGDNSSKSDESVIKRAAEAFKEMKIKKDAFNAKMRERHEREVSGPLKGIGIKMKHAAFYLDNHIMETGDDEDAVNKAQGDRAMMLDTGRRIHAALHDGEQLDWEKLQAQADKARAEAEAEASEADSEEDSKAE